MTTDFLTERKTYLAKLSEAYYEGEPLVDDAEFDVLLQEYVDAGGEEIVGHGYTVSADRKITHTEQMGSLDKERTVGGLHKWIAKCVKAYEENCDTSVPLTFSVSPKFDGLAIAVIVENDEIKLAATRGDGFIGEDVTNTARNVPTIQSLTGNGRVTGEILLPRENLDRANELRDPKDEKLTQIRNAASGIIRKLNDVNNVAQVLYFADHNTGKYIDEYESDAIHAAIPNILSEFEQVRENYPVEDDLHVAIDGIVFKVVNPDVRNVMGSSSRCPRWAVAFKFEDIVYDSTVVGVDWGYPGKIGRITPVILYKEILIDGGRYERATAHNLTRYNAFAPAVGDGIKMKKSGDIIPFVVAIERKGGVPLPYPNECPRCGADTVVEGEFLTCSADRVDCDPVQGLTLIINALNIKGIQEKAVQKIYSEYLSNSEHLYDALKKMKDLPEGSIARIDGMGAKSEKYIKDELDKAWETASLACWIYGLNVNRVGATVSTTLESTYGSLDNIIRAITDESYYKEVTHLKGVNWGEIVAAKDSFVALRDWIAANGVKAPVTTITAVADDFWGGKKVAITGSLSIPRAHVEDWLRQHGATPQSSFSGSTDILIDAGDGTSKKSVKAREQNKTVVLGDDFMNNHYEK